ncbi:collagen alpha-1(I) chain-like [Camelus ferus]|uniref:Collagen alpha-1(I) chain-like n=1 Tax=Camelus ferus TaxID=419612 RepID=A0A8B8U690_CAMFR|nr:collagen alpha-1(I) chain-like [Camelus ferus]
MSTGCEPPAEDCPDLCLGRLPTRGLHLLPLPTRAQPRRLQGAGNAAATASSPTSRGPAPLPSPPGCAARSRSSTHAEGTFVSRETFCLFPSSASRGDRPPPETKAAVSTQGAGGASRKGTRASDTHTPPHPRKRLGDCGRRKTPGATGTSEPPTTRRPLSTSRPGLNLPRPHQPPAPASRPKHPPAPLSPGSAEQQGKPRAAANSPASAGAASPDQTRRRGKAASPTPAATGCRSGFQLLADSRRLRGAGLRRRSRFPAHAEGPGGAEPGWERGGQAGADARLRRPGRTRDPSSSGPDLEKLKRPREAAPACCVCVAFSLGGCGLTPPPVPRGRASEREKKTFIETIQPAKAEKSDRPRELPPPPPERFAAGRATPAGGSGGGRGLEGGAGYPRKTPDPDVGALVQHSRLPERREGGGRRPPHG